MSEEFPSSNAESRAEKLLSLYPKEKSAIMPLLYIAQEEIGSLTDIAYEWVAKKAGVTPAHARSVATFYTMYYKQPVGRYHIQVCRTLSCMLCGAKDITAHVQKRLGLKAGEISEDGMWSFEEVECLGSCGTAPMVEINDIFFENLTAEKLDKLMDRIEKEQPDLRFSTVRDELGGGLSDLPRSENWKARS
jgi:NADH-quinone oxidoreductase subunit E